LLEMSRECKNEKMFEADLNKFNRIFSAAEKEIEPKLHYYYEPYVRENRKPPALLQQIQLYLPLNQSYMKFNNDKTFWQELSNKILNEER